MSMTPEGLYLQLGQLVATMPNLVDCDLTSDVNQWLGRAAALVALGSNVADVAQINVAAMSLAGIGRASNAQAIAAIVHRALATAELNAPAASSGAFIPAGGAFDAFAQVGKVMSRAKYVLLIVDPYADEKVLTEYAIQVPKGVGIQVLADTKDHKATLRTAAVAWSKQHGSDRPLEVRLAPEKTLHDRLLFVDKGEVWSLTQSLNAFAARSPATIVRLADDVAFMKVDAYFPIWDAASPAI
ncbi:hypothetical protein LPN04_14035 [Rugamonas sp. A1-17]|nr:hypothetical protein [Rugamonas sp. A1-17]